MTPSGADPAQYLPALEGANRVRLRRARAKCELRALGRPSDLLRLASWLLSPPEWLAGARAFEVLRWPLGLDRVAADRALVHAGVVSRLVDGPDEDRRVRELTDRQRAALAAWLQVRVDRALGSPGAVR